MDFHKPSGTYCTSRRLDRARAVIGGIEVMATYLDVNCVLVIAFVVGRILLLRIDFPLLD